MIARVSFLRSSLCLLSFWKYFRILLCSFQAKPVVTSLVIFLLLRLPFFTSPPFFLVEKQGGVSFEFLGLELLLLSFLDFIYIWLLISSVGLCSFGLSFSFLCLERFGFCSLGFLCKELDFEVTSFPVDSIQFGILVLERRD